MKNQSSNALSLLVAMWVMSSTCLLSQQLTAELVKGKIDEVLGQLPRLLKADPSGVEAQRYLAKNELTNSTILSYFYGVESPLHEPTPARQQRVAEVEGFLKAHEAVMLDLLHASSSSNKAPDQLHRLLMMTKPTPEVKSALLEVIHSETSAQSAVIDAYSTIFNLKLDDKALHQEIAQTFTHRHELHTRAELSRSLLGSAMTRWTLEEAEPYFAEFLSIPYKPENFPKRGGKVALSSQYAMAASGLMAYGERGAKYSELLKARLAELDADSDGDAQNTAAVLREVIPIVEGKVNPKPIINFKGQLLGVSQVAWPEWRAAHGGTATSAPQSSKAAPPIVQQPTSKAPEAKPATTPREEPTPSAPWSVIVVLIVAAIGLLWLLMKNRK